MAVLNPSSRLIVKNLPDSVTEDKLRKTFSGIGGGEVTDVSLKYKNGKFRGFGFVGFKTVDQASKALKHLNGNFVGALKIKVEYCADLGDPNKPRSWSKHSKDSSAYKNKNKDENNVDEEGDDDKKKKKKKLKRSERADAILEKYKDDPKFQEFLRVHKRNSACWNDDSVLQVAKTYREEQQDKDDDDDKTDEKEEEDNEDEEEKEEEEDKLAISDMDYLKQLKKGSKSEDKDVKSEKGTEETKKKKKEPKNETYHTVKVTGLPYKAKKKDVKEFFKPLKAKSIRVPRQIKGIAYVGFAEESDLKKALNKNKSILKGNQVQVKKYLDEKKSQDETKNKWAEQEASLKSEETVAESGRIFVRNLCYSVTEEDLEELFKPFGPLTEVTLPIDKLTRKIKGYAIVTFMMPEHAVAAYTDLSGKPFQGRMLHLLPGKAKPGEGLDDDQDTEGMGYKKKKAMKEKAAAQSSHNWNTLFLGSSAVADVMAANYSVQKSDVLLEGEGKNKQSAAVKLALGETQLVSETRKFLEEQGVCLEAFEQSKSTVRSKTVILVRNLPAGVAAEKIRDMFAKHGELGRVVLRPGLVTALVEFHEPSEAKKAFRALAYTKFQNAPLYLEWAPEKALTPSERNNEVKPEVKTEERLREAKEDVGDDEPPEMDATLFVKNLNFDTTDEALKSHFASAGRVHSASVSRKRQADRPGEMLSMGYGFVQFKTKAGAERALKELQRKQLDDHCLELKRSNRATVDPREDASRKRKATNVGVKELESPKLMVRNVPFQADASEIEQIFRTFGELKSVRLPKKLSGDGGHRGFAFVEFNTKSDARRAMDALKHSTHLYGRRLVLEWAEREDTLEGMQRKVAGRFVGGNEDGSSAKRVKKAKIMEDVLLRSGKD